MIIETDTQIIRPEYIESIELLESTGGEHKLRFYMVSGNILKLSGTEEKIKEIYNKLVNIWSEDNGLGE